MKIIISKSQWQEIGKNTGWLKKTSEYLPDPSRSKNESSELNNLTYYQDRETGVEFELGATYNTRSGIYKVDKITKDDVNMKVSISATLISGDNNGQSFTSDANRLAKIHKSLEPKAINPKYNFRDITINSPNEYSMLAYIAKYGRITIQTPYSQSKHVAKQYNEITGEDISNNPNFGEAKDSSKWNTQFRVYLPQEAKKIHGQLSTLYNAIETKNGMEISGSLISGLFKYGFKLGNNSGNIDVIRDNLCKGDPQKEEKFNSGLEL
jgi:hypothetical protein